MKSRQRRLMAIELSLTPQQIVVVWLRDALHAGTLDEGARHSPPYRGVIANAVFRTVTESMKGQPEELIERAILQARQEADLLYTLAVNANFRVMEIWSQREREYVFLLGYLSAEIHGKPTKKESRSCASRFWCFSKALSSWMQPSASTANRCCSATAKSNLRNSFRRPRGCQNCSIS
jgi:hypothetical protein